MDIEPPNPLTTDYIQLALLIVLFSIGAPINLVSFTKLWKKKAPRSTGRLAVLKLHLNIADLLILFVYVTSTACWQITFSWRGGDVLCKCIKFMHSASFQLSSNIMVAVALDRVVTIAHWNCDQRIKTRKHMRGGSRGHSKTIDASALRYVRLFVYLAWFGAILVNLSQFAIWRVYAPFEHRPNWKQCVTVWAIPVKNSTTLTTHTIVSQFTYDLLQLVFVFWAPAALLIISYLIILLYMQRICMQDGFVPRKPEQSNSRQTLSTHQYERNELKRLSVAYEKPDARRASRLQKDEDTIDVQGRPPIGTSPNPRKSLCSTSSVLTSDENPNRDEIELTTITTSIQIVRKKTFRTSMTLIFAYLLFWLPYNVMALWWFIDTTSYLRYGFNYKFLNVLIVLNSVVNPFIYGTLGKRWVCVK